MEKQIRYLLDTNIWLERLLDQEKSEIFGSLLNLVPLNLLFISDFTLHSIGVILSRFEKYDLLSAFVKDLFVEGGIDQLTLNVDDFPALISNMKKFKLDFDDAYQLTLSQKNDLMVVTFDKDFNAKGIKKASPEAILEKY